MDGTVHTATWTANDGGVVVVSVPHTSCREFTFEGGIVEAGDPGGTVEYRIDGIPMQSVAIPGGTWASLTQANVPLGSTFSFNWTMNAGSGQLLVGGDGSAYCLTANGRLP